jgi:hypothetical protein
MLVYKQSPWGRGLQMHFHIVQRLNSILQHVSLTHGVRYSLVWQFIATVTGSNRMEGYISPYRNYSPLAHTHTEVYSMTFHFQRQSCPQIAVHLVNRSAQNIKITVQVWANKGCKWPNGFKDFLQIQRISYFWVI